MNTIDNYRFSGYTTCSIAYDKTASNWKIEMLSDPEQKAVTNGTQPPFGTHEYTLSESLGGDYIKLSINACDDRKEFNCEDGSCIPIERRCDSKFDCVDGTDERTCDMIDIPNFYLKHVPAGMLFVNSNIFRSYSKDE